MANPDISTYEYVPVHENAAIWLDVGRRHFHDSLAPGFRGKGPLFDPLGSAIRDGLITRERVDELISASVSIDPNKDTQRLFFRLSFLNDGSLFPPKQFTLGNGQVLIPPSLENIVEEYIHQCDTIAQLYQGYLHNSAYPRSRHLHGGKLDLVFNPGSHVSPQQYVAWMSLTSEDGPPISRMHMQIARSATIPDFNDVVEQWKNELKNKKGSNGKTNSKGARDVDKKYEPFSFESLFGYIQNLDSKDLSLHASNQARRIRYPIQAVNKIADEHFPFPQLPEMTNGVPDDAFTQAMIDYRFEFSVIERIRTNWVGAFSAVNEIAHDHFGHNISRDHRNLQRAIVVESLRYASDNQLGKEPTARVDAFLSRHSADFSPKLYLGEI